MSHTHLRLFLAGFAAVALLCGDAHEGKNLIPDHPERAVSLRSKLAEWTAQFKPPGIPEKPRNDQESGWYDHYCSAPQP